MCRFVQLKTIQKTSTSPTKSQHMVTGVASSFETPLSWRGLHFAFATGLRGILHEGCLCRTCLPLRCESEVRFSTSVTSNLSISFSSLRCCIKQVYYFGRTYFALWWNWCKRLSLLSLETLGTIRITWFLRLTKLRPWSQIELNLTTVLRCLCRATDVLWTTHRRHRDQVQTRRISRNLITLF